MDVLNRGLTLQAQEESAQESGLHWSATRAAVEALPQLYWLSATLC